MTGNGRIVLDPRLSMIARLVGSCERYADIGCDHGAVHGTGERQRAAAHGKRRAIFKP